MNKFYNCVILSTKSAGSSALQKFLVKNFGFRMSRIISHHENETLFWTKAASILGLHQRKMHRSEIPYALPRALQSLQKFCTDNNLEGLTHKIVTKQRIFEAYLNLIRQNNPLFVEKSPHHLYNQSNLDLLAEFATQYKDEVDIKFIGLVRHPLSVIYSGWERWKHDCIEFEKEWLISNSNLLKNKENLNIEIIRYEDLVAENGTFLKDKLDLEPVSDEFNFKKTSLEKWKTDKDFGHELSKETIELARLLGYSDFDTSGIGMTWKFKSWSTYAGVEMKRLLRASAVYLTLV
jgi:hypothetical protein